MSPVMTISLIISIIIFHYYSYDMYYIEHQIELRKFPNNLQQSSYI